MSVDTVTSSQISGNVDEPDDGLALEQPRVDPSRSGKKLIQPESKDEDIVGAYCSVQLQDGTWRGKYMPRHEIEKRRACAQTQNVWRAQVLLRGRARVLTVRSVRVDGLESTAAAEVAFGFEAAREVLAKHLVPLLEVGSG